MSPRNARGRTKSLTGARGARGAHGARRNHDEEDDGNHQELVMGGGASAPGGNVGGAPPTTLGGAEFMQGVFTAIEQVVRNTVQTMQVPIRTAENKATTAIKAFLQLHPPTFKGEPDPLVAEDWLEQVTRALDTILVIEEDLRVLFFILSIARGCPPMVEDHGGSVSYEVFTRHICYIIGPNISGRADLFWLSSIGSSYSGLPTEGSAAAVAIGGTISHPGTWTITSQGATYLLSVWSGGSYQSTVHAEGEQSGSYGITTTHSVSSGLKGHSSIYISIDFISVQTTGCSSAGSEDARTGLCHNISSGTVGDSWTAGAAIGYLCCARYFTYV
ncbi:hypothetical protein Acr_00g0076060 [Actinidia rufa]|uniref:Uncharacterized protein n=1 Tax=Actinidia rufa TaxID=165716 RepID=A0A7J0DT78_9ERIC|nr:hypothetical protein Acr_00g0076060 [Actinidia rufa]